MSFKFAAVLALPFVFGGLFAVNAAQTSAPNPVTQIGTTEKVCQVTGDIDWETGQPTAGRTKTEFGLGATDLGYPVEHRGKLILLFGDTRPPPASARLWRRETISPVATLAARRLLRRASRSFVVQASSVVQASPDSC